MSKNIIMPEMGEGVIEGTIVSWLKSEGDAVQEDEAVLEVETDKVTVEINSETTGVLLKACVGEGETVEVGTVLAVIGNADETVEDNVNSVAEVVQVVVPNGNGQSADIVTTVSNEPSTNRSIEGMRVSPVVARMVEEHDLDLALIAGTGRNGRITKKDVLGYLENAPIQPQIEAVTQPQRAEPTPVPTPSEPRKVAQSIPNGEEIVPLTGMRRAIAEHMVMSKRTSPHVTTVFEFDFTNVAKHRYAHKAEFANDGIKLTYMPYIIMATVEALKAHPMANAMWTDEGVRLKRNINIGMATAIEQGLLVPVIQHADDLNLRGLARQVNDLANRARNNQLKPTEVQGGTFTITNHGSGGSLIGTPIINQPQVGILGVGMIEKRVKVINDAIAIRPCAYVSFSFDHRILDGATADAFVMDIKRFIETFE